MCVRACSRNNAHVRRTRGHNGRAGGGSIAAEEEGPRLIVFLRINIINVIQQSVLDEGATTPLGKIHSTSLIGATIDRAHSRDPHSASGVPLLPRVFCFREFSRILGGNGRKTWATYAKRKYLTRRKTFSCIFLYFSTSFPRRNGFMNINYFVFCYFY